MEIGKENLFVSIVGGKIREYLFEKPLEYNIEAGLFCLPEVISGPWKSMVRRVKKVVKKYNVQCHMHGPVMDLAYHSRDKDVRALARKKIGLGINIAGELGAGHVVFHSTFNPSNPNPRYPDVWLRRSADFWHGMVKQAQRNDCMIVIENVFDSHPDMIQRLIQAVNSPFFKGCLDVGHAHIFGKVSLVEWIDTLKEVLFHVHLHDNGGTLDDHLALGEGTIDCGALFSAFEKLRHIPACVLEADNEEELKKSIQYLKTNGYFRA